jgi:hypothetical protein
MSADARLAAAPRGIDPDAFQQLLVGNIHGRQSIAHRRSPPLPEPAPAAWGRGDRSGWYRLAASTCYHANFLGSSICSPSHR